jgi:hypothetical protein
VIAAEEPELVASARQIVREHSAACIDNATGKVVPGACPAELVERCKDDPEAGAGMVVLDAFSASVVVQVFDLLSSENRARWPELVERLGCAAFIVRLWEIAAKCDARARARCAP